MRRAGASRDRLVVLGYHNIESTWRWPAPPGSGIKSFARQMHILRRTTNLVPLEQALESLELGRPLPPRAVAITFDDGYRDNLTLAAPLLSRLRIPATVFLVPGFLSGEVHAWWERLGWAMLQARARSVDFEGKHFELESMPERNAALATIEDNLKRSDHQTRLAAVEALVDMLNPSGSYHAADLFLDWDGARSLIGSCITIGSHTMRHAILAREPEQAQRDDLAESRAVLGDRLGVPVTTLAYPNGGPDDYNATTVASAAEAGYRFAVTTWGPHVRPETPPYELCRKMVCSTRPAVRLAAGTIRDAVRTRDRSVA
ncbi:MAG: polysaccharide deacetylase family protein [Actinomycetota bacterium]|nr:polysaccharide deacetylase family protein [Actinomycetota bacterium]